MAVLFQATNLHLAAPWLLLAMTNAENLFGNPALAIGKEIKIKDNKATIIGVIKKMGQSMIGWIMINL